ncbi:4-amino-4-deoxy-L-arabinose transferase [Actinokineospora alba]|uniref:4-amino-4-deoxy-L-arabinose transferase n=1 Tax=Actinokineospora alba TaxID=504798 RepID=A0A1H0FIR3_9PSEU|nr:glycosyltransferase family 39 protein [Actinokineospora alba]TDP69501.1 4-amino-4-deoxy-L-arabinose transferase-like glycosyltransferase [Actinokineospora alba]SDI15358.1 4-amino-4-deoxy-L-arabinose transferase [Actinokineospora alba]SDN94678.1 4-amino-4-deoxy-L-arabinose transferase [Actinokineospora alba]
MTATLDRPHAPASPASRTTRWERPALITLLAATALLYLWDLSATAMGNSFYAAAVQAGTQDWKALFFGSLDPGNIITVDKPPAALWLMGLSGKVFGFSSWSMLLPQALAGVASVWLLHNTVRRWSGPVAGLFAGAGLALTPVAALMFKYNNPDALLVLLLVAGAYCTVRAVEHASPKWIVLAGAAVGFGFLTKMLQAFLVLPAFALVYLIAAPTSLGRRIAHLGAAAVAVVVSAGWFVAVADLWPAESRPYIGGSTDNTVLDLALGYNGLGRIFGGGGGGGMGNTAFGGDTGPLRMFGAAFGSEISWLLPAALIGLVAGLWFSRRRPRTDRTRAALVLWGGWLVVTAAVFSFMEGITHPYYAIALAPAVAALVAIAGQELWRGRDHLPARVALAAMVAVSAGWGFVLLTRDGDWLVWLRWVLAVSGVAAATAIAVGAHLFQRVATAVALVAVVAVSGGTAAYTVATAVTGHSGPLPVSGPVAQDGRQFTVGGGEVSAEVADAMRSTTETWAAASVGAQGAGGLQLASGRPVMAIGGFSGGDPAPTLAQFQAHVAQGQVRYFVEGMGMGRGGNDITSWVRSTFTPVSIGGQTVYDLTAPR